MARGISIAALIFSIVFPIVGLVLGIIAFRQERSAGEGGTMPIVAIVIGAIGTLFMAFIVFVAGFAAFGVFNPDRFVQERCVGDSTIFACMSNTVRADPAADSVSFQVQNGVGYRVLVTGVSSEGSCGEVVSVALDGEPLPVELAPNDEVVVEVACEDGAVRSDAVFQDTFDIEYDMVDGLSALSGSVEIVAEP